MCMSNVISIGASGLDAATRRLSAAASNIANASTPDYQPIAAVQQASPDFGGVSSAFAARGGPPGVDLAREAVDVSQAVNSYKANAAVIRAVDDMQRELLRDFRV